MFSDLINLFKIPHSNPVPTLPSVPKNNPITIAAQKAISKCAKCGISGHWYNDGLCRPEDIKNMEMSKINTATINAFRISPKPNSG